MAPHLSTLFPLVLLMYFAGTSAALTNVVAKEEIDRETLDVSHVLDRKAVKLTHAALVASFQFVFDLLGVSDKLDEISDQLQEISEQLDRLSAQVEAMMDTIEQYHNVELIVNAFSADVRRLKYFMLFVNNDANYDQEGQIIIDERSLEWADAVLSQRDDGIGPVLYNIHEMIIGSRMIDPVLNVYVNGLLLAHQPNVWNEVDRMIDALVEMQKAGYSCWAIALDIADRSDEKNSTVAGLLAERLEDQSSSFTVDERLEVWPEGGYGFVQAATGCPAGRWYTGSRYHDTEDRRGRNDWSSNIQNYIKGDFMRGDLQWEFCMKRWVFSGSDVRWPVGKYCIFAYGTCPSGFQRGSLTFDDDDKKNGNRHSGIVPSGEYNKDTRYDFCCRTGGDVNRAIALPIEKPFVIFPLHSHPCQQVKNMNVQEIWLFWDCEKGIRSRNSRQWPHPKETDQKKNMKVYMCHYSYT